jgi:RNA polymerase sigma-70 factor (ECF subfamily)
MPMAAARRRLGKTPVAGLGRGYAAIRRVRVVYAVTRSRLVRYGVIDGLPGFITIERGDILQSAALEIEDGRIVAISIVRNPDKLKHVADNRALTS